MNPPTIVPETVKKNKKFKIHSRKDFLNKSWFHSDASVFSQIEVSQSNNFVECYISFKIRDCDRTVNLSFTAMNDNEFKNSNYKIDKLIKHLSVFKENINKAHTRFKQLKENNNDTGIS